MNAPIARKGKIGRCPPHIRDEVNRRLFAAEPASKILPWLNSQAEVLTILDAYFGEEPVTAQNLSEWRTGGYAEWLARRERVAQLGELAGYAAKLGEAAGGSVTDGSAAILGGRILERLEAALEAGDDTKLGELAEILCALRTTDLAKRKADQHDRVIAQKDRIVALDEKRFQVRACEEFIRLAEDKRALEIATGSAAKDVKIEELRQLMFPMDEPLDPRPLNES